MSYHFDDTICAIATARGGAARGMVRVSGPDTIAVVSAVFEVDDGSPLHAVRQPTALAGHVMIEICRDSALLNPPLAPPYEGGELRRLPCDLFLWPTPRSYTREPLAELHTIGSPPLLEALLATVCRAGARLAEPGEFTLRAFLAGRIDLTQAEAVLGVIDAHSENELTGALTQLAGGLARPLQRLRDELLQLLAELEAGLDFADEDIEFISSDEVRQRLDDARELLADVSQQMSSRHTSRGAMQVVLVGEPNVGKSSLFNALIRRREIIECGEQLQRAPALVSSQKGTTRDYLTATIDLDGLQCELLDTAGVTASAVDDNYEREALDFQPSAIDSAAQAQAAEQHKRAAVRAYCVDSSHVAANIGPAAASADMLVLTKSDRVSERSRVPRGLPANMPSVVTSSRTGEGLDDFCAALRKLLTNEGVAQHGQIVAVTAERCRESIRLADSALRRARETVLAQGGDELVAAELRIAVSELGKVVGTVYTDDLLDRIFSSFCIGK